MRISSRRSHGVYFLVRIVGVLSLALSLRWIWEESWFLWSEHCTIAVCFRVSLSILVAATAIMGSIGCLFLRSGSGRLLLWAACIRILMDIEWLLVAGGLATSGAILRSHYARGVALWLFYVLVVGVLVVWIRRENTSPY